MMNIHLSRPGGQREGPFTLDEINRDLAANKYRETDYWAWYEGLTEWVPLHQVPGIVRSRIAEPTAEPPTDDVPQYATGDTEIIYGKDATPEEPASEERGSEEPASEHTASEGASSDESASQEQGAKETEIQPESGRSESEEVALEQPASETVASEEVGTEEPVSEDLESGELVSEAASDAAAIGPEQESSSQESSLGEAAPEDPMSEDEAPEEPAPQEPVSEESPLEEVPTDHAEDSQAEAIPPSLAKQLHSGMPLEALEQVLLLSSGDAQAASRSAVTSGMLEAAAGEDLNIIRERIPRDAMGGCAFLEKLRGGGSIPEIAWRAASTLKPELVRQAREGLYRICVRTFPIESGEMVALFLFYNKQML